MSEAVPLAHALVARLAELGGRPHPVHQGPDRGGAGRPTAATVDRRRRALRAGRPGAARPRAGALRLAAPGARRAAAQARARLRSTSSSTRCTTSTTSGRATSTSTTTSRASSPRTKSCSRALGATGAAPPPVADVPVPGRRSVGSGRRCGSARVPAPRLRAVPRRPEAPVLEELSPRRRRI